MIRVSYASGRDSDMFYEVRVAVPDKFFYIDLGEKKFVFLDHREFEVFRKKNKNPQIETVLLNPFLEKAAEMKEETSGANKLALVLFEEYKLLDSEIEVPVNFPLDMADFLRSKGVKLKPTEPFYSQRRNKNKEEIENIKQSLTGVYRAYDRIKEILAEAEIKDNEIIFENKVVTSELLKEEVDRILLASDMANIEGMIISSGNDAAIPHHMGEGVIRPYTTIICDIFPQNRTTRYFADLTRTFVKGKPSEKILKMYNAVLAAQEAGIAAVGPGIKGSQVHDACVQVFLKEGFDVGDKGFVHGTGHSLGIDVHEGPYLNKVSQEILEPGNVITIEPGLYYSELGGIRIEDDILVTEEGYINLTKYSKEMVIL